MYGITAKEACRKHKSEPIYEVRVFDITDRGRFVYQSEYTLRVYLTIDEAKEVAHNIARGIAWDDQRRALDDPDWPTEDVTMIVCVMAGKKVSKNGTIYGFSKAIYTISAQPKEVTERFVMDKRFKYLQIDEYTEHPKLTKDMFYQWDE